MLYCVCKQSPRIPLQLFTLSSWRSHNMTTLSYLGYDLLQILWTSDISLPVSGTLLTIGKSTGTLRPVVQVQFRHSIFDHVHPLLHPSIQATQNLITARYVWPGINKDVQRQVKTCIKCRRSKLHQHRVTLLSTFTTSDARFHMVHIDIVGPLPHSNKFRYIVACVDQFTRRSEAIPITDVMAETVAQAFISTWIARFGIRSTILTYKGRQFDSCLWNELIQLLSSKPIRTMAYHPSSNCLIEWFH